ncbi:MAG: hypothetical protein WC796_00405 [Candidatus Pacearchaeota archaeon]|jgi:hypothetical protein
MENNSDLPKLCNQVIYVDGSSDRVDFAKSDSAAKNLLWPGRITVPTDQLGYIEGLGFNEKPDKARSDAIQALLADAKSKGAAYVYAFLVRWDKTKENLAIASGYAAKLADK